MNTKVKNFEFLDLLNLNNNDLKSSVTVPDVILILNSYLKQADTPKDEILLHSITFISNKLLTVFGTDTGLLQLEELFMNLYDIFEIIIDSISRNQRTIKDSKISDFLHNLQIILEKIGEEDELKLSNLSVYIIYGIKFLVKYFSLLKDFECRIDVSEENEMILSTILEQSLGLHSKILSILNENVNLLICQGDDGPLETIEKFLLNLLSITKILVSFNIIACSTTLKFLLKLSIVNSKYFENQIDKNFKWLTDAVKFLCEQVHSLLLQFHNEEFRKGCVNDITKYLKVSLFFIQCMIKVTEHFDVQNIFGFHHIIPVFFEIYRLQSILSSNIHCLIEQYLTANILSLIRIVYKTEDFIGELLKKSHDSIDDSRFCILGIEIIDSLARAKDQYEFSVYFYGQFFKILFEKIPNCVEIFLLQENYIKLEAGMISLWNLYHENLDVMKAFEEILVEGILQYDLKLSKICFDIWIYLARTVNTKSRCHYFEFWRDLHETFPIICYDPKIVSIECLIKVFYDSLPKEYKNDIWSNDNSIDRSRLIYTLGTNSIIDELKRLSLENYFQGKLEENLNLIIEKHNYDYQIYINLVKLFKLVTKSKSFDRNMSRLIMSLIEVILYNTNFHKHEYFINVFIEFLFKNSFFNVYEKKIIWQKLRILENYSIAFSTKLYISYFKEFLKEDYTTSRNSLLDIENKIVDEVTIKFDNLNSETELLKQLKTIKCPSLTFWSCEADLAKELSLEVSVEHNMEIEPPLKKVRASTLKEGNSSNVIKETLENVKKISTFFECNELSFSDLQDLKNIVLILNNIINPK